MSALDHKLLRDFVRLWAQGLAIALVLAAGVTTLLLGIGTLRALSGTQQAYYERYRFADVFAAATRLTPQVLQDLTAIPGVGAIDARIQREITMEIEGVAEPVNGIVLSIPDFGSPRLNDLFLVKGRLPELGRNNEIVVSGAFADVHKLEPGSRLAANMNGKHRTLEIVGVVLSPEYVYSVGSGDIMPDDRRFGVIWMRYQAVAVAFNMRRNFNNVTISLLRGAHEQQVIGDVDRLLRPYGGLGAYGRDQQISHAFLDSELTQLRAMSFVLPPIFLAVAAFLVNMTLGRLITLEREQIGLFKALGYGPVSIAWHYVKLSFLIAVVGVVIGWAAGVWLGRQMAALYAEFYRFPFLIFDERPDMFAVSSLAALLAAGFGSTQAVLATVRLQPAVAMSPPVPPSYSHNVLDRWGIVSQLPAGLVMAFRSMIRRPLRSSLTAIGIALATSLLVAGLFAEDSLDFMIDATFFRAERQQASLTLSRPVGPSGMEAIRRLPGVLAAEPTRSVAVILRSGHRGKRAALVGKLAQSDLSRVVDLSLETIVLPDQGLVLSEGMARILDVRLGDTVEIELADGTGRIFNQPVSLIVQQFIGLGAYMEIRALNRLLGEGDMANSASLMMDTNAWPQFFSDVKKVPAVAGTGLERISLQRFRDTVGQNIGTSRAVYVTMAVIIVFGVVYNAMRIQLSERARELASLRVLGFTLGEVSLILFAELACLTAIAIPAGWLGGFGLALAVTQGFESELFRIPLVIDRSTYATAGLVVAGAALVSGLLVRRRVASLDMVAVLKTRD